MPLWTFFVAAGVEAVLALAWLLLIPPDPKNALLLGFSLQRWALIGVLLAAALACGAGARLARGRARVERLAAFFLTPPALWIALGGMYAAALAAAGLRQLNPPLLERLLPALAWLFAAAFTSLLLQLVFTRGALWERTFSPPRRLQKYLLGRGLDLLEGSVAWLRAHPAVDIWIVLVLGALPTLANTLRFSQPLGYAGLYALMSEEVAQGGFALPSSVPFYGPGGIPFAYPPLGFYLMALFLRLGVPAMAYLRFAGPLFTWLSLAPITWLGREVTRSRLAAVIAALAVATFDSFYAYHAFAAGMVRAPGFIFSCLALLFFLRAARPERIGCRPAWKDTLLSGIFFTLALLTHLSYAEFVALSVILYVLFGLLQARRWLVALGVALLGLLLSAPWWATVLSRYGAGILSGIFFSHDNNYFLLMAQDPGRVLPWFNDALRHLFESPALWGLALGGAALSLALGNFFLPVWFLALLVFTSGDRFLVLTAAFLAGGLLAKVRAWMASLLPRRGALGGAVFAALLLAAIYLPGLNTILAHTPELSPESDQLQAFVAQNTSPGEPFLIVAVPDEAEWMPYLLRRTPSAASWGSEWIGGYNAQLSLVSQVIQCQASQSLPCLRQVMSQLPQWPNLLITHSAETSLASQLEQDPGWQKIYQDTRYLVWSHR